MLPPWIEQIYFDKGYYTIILVCLLDILNIYPYNTNILLERSNKKEKGDLI